MIKKIKNRIHDFRKNQFYQTAILEELEWAHIYHDTIRSRHWLQEISISPGRWAANYSFLYILVQILGQYKPAKIIEFGLGESSKLITSFCKHEIPSATHTVLEHDRVWVEHFQSKFTLSSNTRILETDLKEVTIKNNPVTCYSNIEQVKQAFDLYVIDGPYGSDHFSRYDIHALLKHSMADEFIVIIDDYNRSGEQETAKDVIKLLAEKNIETFSGIYSGKKSQLVICTGKYKYAASL